MGMVFYLATLAGVYGQVAASSPSSSQQASPAPDTAQEAQNQATLQAFEQEQQVLFQQLQALMAQGATPQQIEAWHEQNAAQFAAQQQRAQALAAASALQPLPVNTQPYIPANASPTLTDLLTTQASLANAHAQIHNQLLQSMPADVSQDQINQMEQQEMETFQQQQAGNLQTGAQQAQTLANELAQQPLPVPPPLILPPDATPQMAAYLTLRDQLSRGLIALHNQYLSAAPSVQQAALQQWQQQNAGLIQQMQQQAQNLAQASSTTQN
jgi:hypothetical protein